MRKAMKFSKLFLPTAIFSILLTTAGVISFLVVGVNLGVDFRPGIIQEVQFAPTAFSLTWSGRGSTRVEFDRSGMYVIMSGVGVETRTVSFPFADYGNIGALIDALTSQIEGINASLIVSPEISTQWLIRSAQGNPQLGAVPYLVHYLDPQSPEISIATVREAIAGLGQTAGVQSLGQPNDRHFMIRIETRESKEKRGNTSGTETGEGESADNDSAAESALGTNSAANVSIERITNILENYFGSGEVVVLRSDKVESRFSKNLREQAGYLLGLTLLIILIYASIRFKPQYAVGAVVGILHDAIVIVAFVVWSRMEFTTSTIAAILTILGYSINNTIVIFDRIRENRRIYPNEDFTGVLDRSLTETMSRTIITTLTTMLAVVALFIFTTGSMKDFSLALLIGMISGVYTSIFIASGIVNFWENLKAKREKQKSALPAAKGAVSKA